MQDSDERRQQEQRVLQAIAALVEIEMIALGQAKAQAGATDAERLQVIADVARVARVSIMGKDAMDLRAYPGN